MKLYECAKLNLQILVGEKPTQAKPNQLPETQCTRAEATKFVKLQKGRR
jgi:hypothetical protein